MEHKLVFFLRIQWKVSHGMASINSYLHHKRYIYVNSFICQCLTVFSQDSNPPIPLLQFCFFYGKTFLLILFSSVVKDITVQILL